MLNTSVLFLVFNRPDTTHKVFARIREARPKQLFVAADGPRKDKEGEKEKCEEVRKFVLDNIDWDCEVKTLFREQNLGCGKAVSEAITWFFDNVEQGIILEDDTLPDLSFFGFCEEMLNYYADNEQIMMVTGTNFQFGHKRGNASYYFSRYTHIWGWATWRRVWQEYDYKLAQFDKLQNNIKLQKEIFINEKERKYFMLLFRSIYEQKIDTWDYQLMYLLFTKKGLDIIPNNNLISNLGFGLEATHTIQSESNISNLPVLPIYQIIHPDIIKIDKQADGFALKYAISSQANLKQKIRNFIVGIIPQNLKRKLKTIVEYGNSK